MIHRMTPLSNPRLFIFYSLLVSFPLAGFFVFTRLPPMPGAAALAAGAFLSYRLMRFAKPYLETKIITGEEGITFTLPGQGDETFPWEEISLSGKCTHTKGRSFIFTYNAGRDRLISIPYEYTDMAALEDELAARTPYEVFFFPPGASIRGVIQERFPQEESAEESADE